MICPRCAHEQPDGYGECLLCGVIFAKVSQRAGLYHGHPGKDDTSKDSFPENTLSGLLFSVKPDTDPVTLGMKVMLLAVLVVWGFKLFFTPIGEAGNTILHFVNLPFHEAGHIFFRLFGEFMTVLGGSIFQLIMPLLCAGVLLFKTRDPFGASVALWWFGENFIDMAPYINDARALELTLLGGVTGRDVPGIHDWENILGTLGLLEYDHALAHGAEWLGFLVMFAACAWAGYVLLKGYAVLRSRRDLE
jgi:hypothetical protein